MPPSLHPPLPRSAADPVRLQSLRQRALARMAQDEDSGHKLTRRRSLKHFALVAAAATPVVRRFFRGQQALAATPRTNAPQYGAPPMYHPPPTPPYPDYSAGPSPIRALPATREMLGSVTNWSTTSVELLGGSRGGLGPNAYPYDAPAWSILYTMRGSKPFPFTAVADNSFKVIYFVRGNHDFYVSDKSGVYAVSIGKGILTLHRALFQFRGYTPQIGEAVTAFAANVDDTQIRQDETRLESIDITPGIPFEFWNTTDSSPLPTINSVYYGSNIAAIDLLSPSGKFTAAIWIDIKSKKVTKAFVNGKLVYGTN